MNGVSAGHISFKLVSNLCLLRALVKNPHRWKSTDEISSQLISTRQKKILDELRNIDSLIHIFLRSKKRANSAFFPVLLLPSHRDTPGTWEVGGANQG
jgi:exoribonuclease II